MRKLTLSFFLAVLSLTAMCRATSDTLSIDRIHAISATLEAEPRGAGQPVTNRQFWDLLAKNPVFQSQITAADKWNREPIPPIPDELFLEFSRIGNRVNYEKAAFSRRNKLTPLVLAECLKNDGSYLMKITELVNALCKERTWVLPAHDKSLSNFHGTNVTIDLFSSSLAWQLAQTDYMLGGRLDPVTRANLKREIARRILKPFQGMIRRERKADWWLKGHNNWNPVCMSGVTGAGLIELSDARERAELIAAGEHYSQYFLDGFTSDGYCSEGLGYWNYGFGMFSAMAQNFRMQTRGEVDLFAMPGAAMPATYGSRIGIINGVYPAFSDCPPNIHPSSGLMWLLNKTYNWKLPEYASLDTRSTLASLYEAMIYQDAISADAPSLFVADLPEPAGARTFFSEAGVYIGRPDNVTGKADEFAVAFKGGNNGESHNHNDLGSYVVVIGSVPILLDPGRETYTKRTFGPQRYDSKLLNSFGHSVPVVAGGLQQAGKKFAAKILSQNFGSTTDTIELDIASPYKGSKNLKLTRKFEYGRSSRQFVITDHVEFKTPQEFETALISLGEFSGEITTDSKTGVVAVNQGAVKAKVEIEASAAITLSKSTIEENSPVKPNRLGIKFAQPVQSATVRMTVTPTM